MTSSPDRAVVITGAGLVCAAGRNVREAWNRIVSGHHTIRPLAAMEQSRSGNAIGGEIPDEYFDASDSHKTPREVRMLRKSIREAMTEAGLVEPSALRSRRCAIILGTTLGGMRSAGEFLRSGDHGHLRSFLAGRTLNLAAIDLPHLSYACTTCAACASGLYAIAMAATLLQSGDADVVIAGGYDPISEYAYAGFKSLRLVSDDPPAPFSSNRSGMNLGEGSGIVILERAEDAARRKANVIAQLAGWGESSDVHHLTQPHPQGAGIALAMQQAISMSDSAPASIDMICAHATATPANDAAEFAAYETTFGDSLPRVPIVALKSHLGHTLGGAGAVELVLASMALREQMVPPTAGTTLQDLEFPRLNLTSDGARPASVSRVLITSMGFGGANACMVLQRARIKAKQASTQRYIGTTIARDHQDDRDPVITGVGVVLADCIGHDAFLELLSNPGAVRTDDAQPIPDEAIEHLINARRARRISRFAKMMLAATTNAMRDAGIEDVPGWAATSHAVLGTTHGAAQYSEDYYRQVVRESVDAANPMLFAEGVPNVASAQLSLMLGVRGGAQTIVGSRTAGLDALGLAARRIRLGDWDRVIVGAAEEVTPLMIEAYRTCYETSESNGQTPSPLGCGAVVLVVESRKAAAQRRARIRASIESVTSRHVSGSCAAELARAGTELLAAHPSPDALLCGSDTSWTGCIERAAIREASANHSTSPRLESITGRIGETFSVDPLAGIAALLLAEDLHVTSPIRRSPDSWRGVLCADVAQVSHARLHMKLPTGDA